MALIKCPECKREISDKALSCPHCGMPFDPCIAELHKMQDPTDNTDIREQEENVDDADFEEQKSYDNSATASKCSKSKLEKVFIFAVIAIALYIVIKIVVDNIGNSSEDISSNMRSYGESAVKAVDDYIDNDIDFETAYRKLKGLRDQAENESNSELYEYNKWVYSGISGLCSRLYFESNGSGTYSELLESRDRLDDLLDRH